MVLSDGMVHFQKIKKKIIPKLFCGFNSFICLFLSLMYFVNLIIQFLCEMEHCIEPERH